VTQNESSASRKGPEKKLGAGGEAGEVIYQIPPSGGSKKKTVARKEKNTELKDHHEKEREMRPDKSKDIVKMGGIYQEEQRKKQML